MALVLASGVVFWGAVAFLGARQMFTERNGPLIEPLSKVKGGRPQLLLAVGVLGPLVALFFVVREVISIQRMEGYLGTSFLFAVLCAVAGSLALAAHFYLDD